MTIVVTRPVHFRRRAHGRRVASTKPSPLAALPATRVPRVARLMALAITLDRRLRAGEFKSVGAMARHFRVSQPRMTQILNLTLLAPDIAEEVLSLSRTPLQTAKVTEHGLRSIVMDADWGRQKLYGGSMIKVFGSRCFYAI